MTARPYGYVSKPITCPCCNVITAVPFDYQMFLTDDAAGMYPSGYRCRAHAVGPEAQPQPSNAPKRLTPSLAKLWAEIQAKAAANPLKKVA